MSKMIFTIALEETGWSIVSGERYQDHLDWGEMISTLARITCPRDSGDPILMLRTREEHERFYAHLLRPVVVSEEDEALIVDVIN